MDNTVITGKRKPENPSPQDQPDTKKQKVEVVASSNIYVINCHLFHLTG